MTTFDNDTLVDQAAVGSGSPSYLVRFKCETIAGTRFMGLRAKPYDALTDDYWLEIQRNDGSRLAIFEDFTYVLGYPDGMLNLSNAGIFVPGALMISGPLVVGATRHVTAGGTLDLSTATVPYLLGTAPRIPCYPSPTAGCTVKLPNAFYGLRYEVGDYSGNASTTSPVSVYTSSGETINGVDYSTSPLQITTPWKQLTLQGDDIGGTNWVIG